jgi:hypothetical protein
MGDRRDKTVRFFRATILAGLAWLGELLKACGVN